MIGNELRTILKSLELPQVIFARLVGVTTRAVNMWVQGEREIPGPAEAYLRVFQMLPANFKAVELERITGKEKAMREGMYQISFHTSGNPENWGVGTLIFGGGTIYGVDAGGAKYDGIYVPTATEGVVNARVKVTFPPNGMSIFGIMHPYEWSIEVTTQMDSRNESGNLNVRTNLRSNVSASYQFLRSIPEAA